MTALWIFLVAFLAFLAIIVVRACMFKPSSEKKVEADSFSADTKAAAEHLRQMVRLKTVSSVEESQVDLGEFEKFRALLRTLYPHVYAACEYSEIGRHGMLLKWTGHSAERPSVLMAHYDVVPADPAEWDEPPFEGVIKGGELWGRGTLDTKCTLMGVMEAAESLIARGFTPKNDVYFAFGGDEEVMGGDAPAIVAELERRGVHPVFVLDEGGAIVEKVFPGVDQPAALIGIAEKGSAFLDLTAVGKGGHASAPPARQSVGVLARALDRIARRPMPFVMTPPARELFDLMGRHSSFVYKLIFANLWCFRPALDLICKKSGGELNALVRTTCALTRLSGAEAYNVLPNQSRAGVNARVICGETVESVRQRMERAIGDPNVRVTVVEGNDPSPVSPTSGEPWERLSAAIRQTYPGVLVAPYLMLACSDSRHYCRICPNVYRFSGMPLSKEQRGMIHNRNERIPLSLIPDMVAFFGRVLERC